MCAGDSLLHHAARGNRLLGGEIVKYKIEFELPDNETVLKEIKTSPVKWAVWGYTGYCIAKPIKKTKKDKQEAR